MKKILLLSVVLCGMLACGSPEKKAQKLIKAYLMENLKDPDSYRPAEFGKLDSAFQIYIDTEEGERLFNERFDAENRSEKLIRNARFESDPKKGLEMLDSAQILLDRAEKLDEEYKAKSNAFKGAHIGWRMVHTYRAKNGYGAMDIGKRRFYFDKDVSKITSTDKIE